MYNLGLTGSNFLHLAMCRLYPAFCHRPSLQVSLYCLINGEKVVLIAETLVVSFSGSPPHPPLVSHKLDLYWWLGDAQAKKTRNSCSPNDNHESEYHSLITHYVWRIDKVTAQYICPAYSLASFCDCSPCKSSSQFPRRRRVEEQMHQYQYQP